MKAPEKFVEWLRAFDDDRSTESYAALWASEIYTAALDASGLFESEIAYGPLPVYIKSEAAADILLAAGNGARATARILELESRVKLLDQYLHDTSDGFECVPKCDSYGHEDDCPVTNLVEAWRLTRARVRELEAALAEWLRVWNRRASCDHHDRHLCCAEDNTCQYDDVFYEACTTLALAAKGGK